LSSRIRSFNGVQPVSQIGGSVDDVGVDDVVEAGQLSCQWYVVADLALDKEMLQDVIKRKL